MIGAGLAGLSAALAAAPRQVLVLSPAPLAQAAASAWAQGGVAAAVDAADARAHAADTVAAGAGLVEPAAAARLTEMGAATVERLAALGAPFDRDAEGHFVRSLEAAHSRARVARVGGDGAGRAIMAAVVAAVLRRAAHRGLGHGARLRGLLQDADGRVRGALDRARTAGWSRSSPRPWSWPPAASAASSRSPPTPAELRGEGLALAALAGADDRRSRVRPVPPDRHRRRRSTPRRWPPRPCAARARS